MRTHTHVGICVDRQFVARLEKDFPGQSHQVRNDMVLLLVMAGNDYLKASALDSQTAGQPVGSSTHTRLASLLFTHAPAHPPHDHHNRKCGG